MLRRRLLLSSVALVSVTTAAGALAGCSGDEKKAAVTPEQALAAAKEKLAAAKFVHISLYTNDLPSGQNGVSVAAGTGEISTTEPKFKGQIQGRVQGITANVEMIAVGEKAWWKLFTPDYTAADLTGIGAPNPASFFQPSSGVPDLLARATDLKSGAQTRVGSEILDTYVGKLPGKVVKDLLYLGDGTGTFEVTFGITAKGELRQTVTTGPFFAGTPKSTYTLLLTDYGKSVTITAPQ